MKVFQCPNCGGNELNGRFCAYCDSEILDALPETEESTIDADHSVSIPVGEYHGCNCSVVLEEDAFIIRSVPTSGKDYTHEVRIPYHEVCSLLYYRPQEKFISTGYIVVRWSGNARLPIPSRQRCDQLRDDPEETLIWFTNVADRFFIYLLWFLKSMAPQGTKCEIVNFDRLPTNADDLMQCSDMDWCFNKCNPYREWAAYEFARGMKVKKKVARLLVNLSFDQRLQSLYDSDPTLAVRDLNIVVQQAVSEQWTWLLKG